MQSSSYAATDTSGDKDSIAAEVSAEKTPRRVRSSKKSASAFRTISEVADELDVQQHVLRFWETKFSHIRPLKRGGGRRYYRPEDMDLLKRIHHLLYTEGYTIKGVQKLLRDQGKKAFLENGQDEAQITKQPSNDSSDMTEKKTEQTPQKIIGLSNAQRSALKDMLGYLKDLREEVTG